MFMLMPELLTNIKIGIVWREYVKVTQSDSQMSNKEKCYDKSF